MDSPLNRAHQMERKAEKFIFGKKYSDAILCYERAAAHIIEAMKETSSSQALLSMQLQYEDHLRQQKLLKIKIDWLVQTKKRLQAANEQSESMRTNLGRGIKTNVMQNIKKKDCEVINHVEIDSSSKLSLQSSEGILVPCEGGQQQIHSSFGEGNANIHQPSVQDLQMQVLTLTQALEDSNRENNHLRNIVIRFKEVLHEKFGFSEEEIECMLFNHQSNPEDHLLSNFMEDTNSEKK